MRRLSTCLSTSFAYEGMATSASCVMTAGRFTKVPRHGEPRSLAMPLECVEAKGRDVGGRQDQLEIVTS